MTYSLPITTMDVPMDVWIAVCRGALIMIGGDCLG